jgi:hypothetical protein
LIARIDVNRISPLRSSIKASLRLALFYYVKMVGLLLIGGCRNKKIFIFKGISATADAVRIQSSRHSNTSGQEIDCFFCVILYVDIPSPTPPFAKGRGLVADKARSKLSAVRLFSLMELELKAVAEIKYI